MSTADLYLLGSGVCSFLDITLSTQDLLRRCAQVYYLHDLPSLERYLAKVCRRAVNLMPVYYRDGRDRADLYGDVVRHVVECAVELGVQPRVTSSSIAELPARHAAFNYNSSLHIPPVPTV